MAKISQRGRLLEKEVFIQASPERVFQALTAKEELERWFVSRAEFDLSPGGTLKFKWGPGECFSGEVLVFEPPRRLSYTWEADNPGINTLTFELTAENDGTRLRLVHTGIGESEDWDQYYDEVHIGWNEHFTNLIAWLERGCERAW